MSLEEIRDEFLIFDAEVDVVLSTPIEVREATFLWKKLLMDDCEEIEFEKRRNGDLKISLLDRELSVVGRHYSYMNKIYGVINEVNYSEAFKLVLFTAKNYEDDIAFLEKLRGNKEGSNNFGCSNSGRHFEEFFVEELERIKNIRPIEKKKEA